MSDRVHEAAQSIPSTGSLELSKPSDPTPLPESLMSVVRALAARLDGMRERLDDLMQAHES